MINEPKSNGTNLVCYAFENVASPLIFCWKKMLFVNGFVD